MPIYEYTCRACGRPLSLFFRSFAQAQAQAAAARCPHCQSQDLERRVSRPTLLHGDRARLETLSAGANLDALDAEDPHTMARLLRDTGAALGEPLEGEMVEIVGRLDAGESPAAVGAALPPASASSPAAE